MNARLGTFLSSGGFMALGIWIMIRSASLDERAALFPRVAAALILAGAFISIVRAIVADDLGQSVFADVSWTNVAVVALFFACALVAVRPLGFPIAAVVFFAATAIVMDVRAFSPGQSIRHIFSAVVFAVATTWLFVGLLGVSLPLGPINF